MEGMTRRDLKIVELILWILVFIIHVITVVTGGAPSWINVFLPLIALILTDISYIINLSN